MEVPSVVHPWPLMGSPTPIICIFVSYLALVLKILPKFMKTRQPFNLTNFTRIYNILQVVVCTYLVTWGGVSQSKPSGSVWQMWLKKTGWSNTRACIGGSCARGSPSWLKLSYLFYAKSKVRFQHCTFTITSARLTFFGFSSSTLQVSGKDFPNAKNIFWILSLLTTMDMHTAFVNTCVHIVMYSYNFLTSFKALNKRLSSINPYITLIQLLQLGLVLGHNIIPLLPSCNESKLSYLFIINIVILIYFFAEF